MYTHANYRASIALRSLICRKGCLGFGLPIVITASDRANAMHACYGCYYYHLDQSRPTGPWQQYYWSAKGRLRCYCTGLIHNNWVRWIHDAVDRAVRAEQESNRRQKKSRKRHLKQSISPAVLLRTPSCLPHPVRAYVFVLGDGNIRRTRGGTSPFERFLSLFFFWKDSSDSFPGLGNYSCRFSL